MSLQMWQQVEGHTVRIIWTILRLSDGCFMHMASKSNLCERDARLDPSEI